MSEPKNRAERVERVIPGVFHWTIHDDRIDFRSDAYAVKSGVDSVVLIDPLPLSDEALDGIGRVAAICLTGAFHQRSAWRLRERLSVPVHAPAGGQGYENRPDASFEDGARLPGNLLALHKPGPTAPHYVFLREPEGALFVADLLMRAGDEPFAFVPDEHQDDPARTRESVRSLLGLPVTALCPAHGAPRAAGAVEAMRSALARDARSS